VPNLTLVQLLAELGGAQLEFRREDALLSAAVLVLPQGRRLIAMERTYREGIHILLDPTPEELATVRQGDLWTVWNSERGQSLYGAV
jgi:hypothetical protein